MKLILDRALLALASLAMMATVSPIAAQSAKGTSPGACSLLTKELVLQVTPETNKAELDRLFGTPPEEHLLGPNRSLGVVITVPQGRTAESIKPNAVALAKAVLSRPW